MRKIVLLAVMAVATATAFGQGVIINTIAANAVLRTRLPDLTAAGSGFVAGLYAGAPGADESSLKLYGPLANLVATGTSQGFINSASGGGQRDLTSANSPQGGGTLGPTANTVVQLRVWSSGYASYEDALASGLQSVLIGKGPVVTVTPSDASDPLAKATQILWKPGSTTGNQATWGFVTLAPVPEPSMMVLGGLGLIGALLIRRRK